MASPDKMVIQPIPISRIAGRYLIFDNDIVAYLRKTHNICGVLIGSIPQIPQQNVFLGLPVELLPEEAKILVQEGVGYVLDAPEWHKDNLSTLKGADRRAYLESLWLESRKAQKAAEGIAQRKAERGLAKHAPLKEAKESQYCDTISQDLVRDVDMKVISRQGNLNSLLFNSRNLSPTALFPASSSIASYSVTPTCTLSSSLPQESLTEQEEVPVPASYPLFAHLHAHSYFITPGLRFGCDYAVYPGDPLRFHSHFLAVGYDWDEEIPLLDVIGGGRLGTGVKKSFLIGAEEPIKPRGGGRKVRTFCIEWGGM